ncbi:hypothetical protein F511_41237 [Dorcoceras hygrometricum]|uniref:Uncharacterized protein n=1 Tax=Dorcoceras hygrometricum TaxID=472368 RepID=A0A2Z7AHN1_9LAMI|nr:hypothetical protein F511_41237 [Dorcoceras hygrometricum]
MVEPRPSLKWPFLERAWQPFFTPFVCVLQVMAQAMAWSKGTGRTWEWSCRWGSDQGLPEVGGRKARMSRLVGDQLGMKQSWSLKAAQDQEITEQAQLQTKRGADAEVAPEDQLEDENKEAGEEKERSLCKQTELEVIKGCRSADEKSSSHIKPATH